MRLHGDNEASLVVIDDRGRVMGHDRSRLTGLVSGDHSSDDYASSMTIFWLS